MNILIFFNVVMITILITCLYELWRIYPYYKKAMKEKKELIILREKEKKSMNVYQVVMESEVNNEITDIVEYVQARDFKTVSDVMVKRAEEVGYTLNSIKYVTIVETLS